MRAGRQPDPKELVPLDHPEITRLGRFLRRTKIDELPQIFNVLRGDMSLIGPRPTLLDQIEAYDEFSRLRLDVRPGCTGLAQIHGGAAISWPERIRYDVYYVARRTIWIDLWVILMTPWSILRGEKHTAKPFADSACANKMPHHPSDAAQDRNA
jgi:lipopolysaccharide/colanic/teichoic acid biosynthesis glycosyltransferase